MSAGVRIGVDVGTVRIGVAACDPDGILAIPVETVPRGAGDVDRLVVIAKERSAVGFVVGLPVTMAGEAGPAAAAVKEFAGLLSKATPIPIRFIDERLTTASAAKSMRSAGRSVKQSRSVIDQQAAVVLLQDFLDAERASREPPGGFVRLEP